MRILLVILSFVTLQVNATKRYVSNAGSNTNNGLTSLAPWRTLAYTMSSITSGDSIYLNRGDVFNEKFIPPSSNIYIGAYGAGAMPIITGFKTATELTNVGNIWSTTLSDATPNLNVVKVNGTLRAKARYPNYDYLQATGSLSATSIKVSHDATNRVGSEIVVITHPYVLDVAKITAHNIGTTYDTLVFSATRTDPTGDRYFLQNSNNQLDTLNEWTFDNTSKLLSIYATSQPIVEYSTIDTLVTLERKSNITFDGVQFTGANTYAMFIDSSRYDTLKNVSFNNNNSALYLLRHRGTSLTGNTIKNSLSYGYFSFQDTSMSIDGNTFDSTGMLPGMGGNGYSTYGHGYNQGDTAIIQNNQFLHAGYHGFRWSGRNDTIRHNYVDGFCYVKNDGGGIYTFAGTSNGYINYFSIVKENIVLNGKGVPAASNYSVGIYLDDGVDSITVDGNTVANVMFADIQTKGVHNRIINNTLYDVFATNLYAQTYFLTDKNNIFYNTSTNKYVLDIDPNKTDYFIDSNYYQSANSSPIMIGQVKTFTQWRTENPTYDVHSITTLPGSATSSPVLYTNLTTQTSNTALSGNYVDVKGTIYNSVITLQPFKSALLWPSTFVSPTIQYKTKFKNLKL